MRRLLALLSASAALLTDATAHAQLTSEKVVAAVIAQEARNQGRAGMLAVGEVIARRASLKDTTPLQIVTARKGKVHAFSSLNGTTPDALYAAMKDEKGFDVAQEVAAIVCRSPEKLPNTTRGATHFTLKSEKPAWSRGRRPVVVIKDHAFYKLSF